MLNRVVYANRLTRKAFFCFLLAFVLIAHLSPYSTRAASAKVYVSPANLIGGPGWIGINDTLTVDVNISLVTGLNYWQVGMIFNPDVLECMNYTEGSFLQTAGETVWQPGTIDNVVGRISAHGASLMSGVGANGSGSLGHITFKVKNTGSSSLVLYDVLLLDVEYSYIDPAPIENGYFELPPPVPEPPTAFFTYSPVLPYSNSTVIFDASSSTPNGGVITEYEWNFGDNSSGQGMVVDHTYTNAGDYSVTLQVTDSDNLTGSFSTLLTIINLSVGPSVDVYTQKGGKGPNEPSDTFAPDELIIITTYATYNRDPVPNALVSVDIYFPNGTLWQSRDVQTNENGLAFITYIVRTNPVFGKYNVSAITIFGTELVSDSLEYSVNYLVQAISVNSCDKYGAIRHTFRLGEQLYLATNLTNNRIHSTYVVVWGTVVDELGYPLMSTRFGTFFVQPGQTIAILNMGMIPKTAHVGWVTTYTGARSVDGTTLCPEVQHEEAFYLLGSYPDIAVIGVSASPTNTYVGHSIKITITMLNEYYNVQDCSVTVYCNDYQIEKLNILALASYEETNFTCIWDTYNYSQGDYQIKAVAANVTGETDMSDNTKTDGIVHLGPRVGLFHDICVTDLNSSKSVVGKGYPTTVTVGLQNQGDYTETFNVTIYINQTAIQTFRVTALVNGGTNMTIFTWNTGQSDYGNNTLRAAADIMPSEIDTDDNTKVGQWIRIGVPGDVSSITPGVPDGVDNMKDVAYLVVLFNTKPSSSNWNPNADVDNNGVVSMIDIAIAILNFNKYG